MGEDQDQYNPRHSDEGNEDNNNLKYFLSCD